MDFREQAGGSWTLLTGHGYGLVEIARNTGARIRDIAVGVGLTERTVQAIIADLEAAGSLTHPGRVAGGAPHLTVDLSGLRFADSASVRELVLADRALHERGGVLVLARPQPGVARVLTMMGMDQAITIQAGTGGGPGPESRTEAVLDTVRRPRPAHGREDEPDA